MQSFILPLPDSQADLATTGGKGASLAKLSRAGLPVPDGFHVTTEAYRQFVSTNGLLPGILSALGALDPLQPSTFEAAAQSISGLFASAAIPPALGEAITLAYAALPGADPAVAVRSSATAEDLPGASFAGQQESYLNVRGAQAVLQATRKCWASLWTARAIAYRLRQGISPEEVALSVTVQLLVPAEAAGILFTANPVSGKRGEALINAAWGLGEAIVGGAVTPDTLTVAKSNGRVLERQTTDKQVMTVPTESYTQEQPVPEALRTKPVLNDAQAAELVSYGVQIEALYGQPMDIEWALAGGKFAFLQARPITALPEAPLEWIRPKPDGVYMRTSIVDLMPDPLSPLFVTLGIPTLIEQMQPLGRELLGSYPVLPDGYYTTINNYAYMNGNFSGRSMVWILFGMLPAYPRLMRILLPFWRDQARPKYIQAVAEYQGKDLAQMSSPELWQSVQAIMDNAGYYSCTLLFATMGASAGSEGLLTKVYEKLAKRPGDPPAAALLMGWDNIPSRSEKSLYDLAAFCRESVTLGTFVLQTPTSELVAWLSSEQIPSGMLPADWQGFCQRFADHQKEFGHVVFDLDFAKPLPGELPEPQLEVIKMYLRGEGTNPHERQGASQERRIRTTQEMLTRLKGFRRWAFSKALSWAQSLSEVREDALADIGLGYPLMRQMLHILGERLVKAGALQLAGDIFWLEKKELAQAVVTLDSNKFLESMHTRVEQRKAFWQKAKQVTPPPMIPMRKKFMGINTSVWLAESEANQAGKTLKGVPTSPGLVTAPACVLHGAEDFDQMRPGDVLVAGTTTPAWTPLFAMASAVVTDIGGPLSHGSIVAREYGIPAVMGTGVATRRIHDGQRITVDGSAGIVTLLEKEA